MVTDIDMRKWLSTNGTTTHAEKLACVVLADSIKGSIYNRTEIPWESLIAVLGMDGSSVSEVLGSLASCGAVYFSYDCFELNGCPRDTRASTPDTLPSGKKRNIPRRVVVEVFSRDGFKCVYCDSPDNLTLDHKTPVSKGGGNGSDNLQVCCHSCNASKGAKTCEEFDKWKAKKQGGTV